MDADDRYLLLFLKNLLNILSKINVICKHILPLAIIVAFAITAAF